jgi:CheY-like chemotaxis protein
MPGPAGKIPVIALTADVTTRRPEEYESLGFNGYVSKPILVSRLLDAIKTAAEPRRAPKAFPYRVIRTG